MHRRKKHSNRNFVHPGPSHAVPGTTNENAKAFDYRNSNSANGETVTITVPNQEKKSQLSPLFHIMVEDMRISKMIRRLSAENNPKAAIAICDKLQIVVRESANAGYIRRAFEYLGDSLISILKHGPVQCLDHVAQVIGLIGYVMRFEFTAFKNWLFVNFDEVKRIRVYLMRALKVTIKCDATSLELAPVSERLLVVLKNLLENADVVADFIAISDVIAEFSSNYKKSFEKYFTDIVDIVVGWHLETEQPSKLKQHCSKVLQRFSIFFNKNIDFTLSLLGQFLEDVGTFAEEIQEEKDASCLDKHSNPLPEVSVGSFVGAFNTILKCLNTENEVFISKGGKGFLQDAVSVITFTACKSLKITSCTETVVNINEFFVIIQNYYLRDIHLNADKIVEIITAEIYNIGNFNDVQISSLLFLILTSVQTMKSETPITLVAHILNPNQRNLRQLKFMKSRKHFSNWLKLYHEILTIKNVPLLQEAYVNILQDIECAMQTFSGETFDLIYTVPQAECALNFYLSAISVLAAQTSSIIGMYALQPTLLELLINDLSASDLELWSKNPALHDAIITLLSVHCIKNHNYILSSNLLVSNVFSKLSFDDRSPTSENFVSILKFFLQIMSGEGLPPEKTLIRILNWLRELYQQCSQHAHALKDYELFTAVGKRLCSISVNLTKESSKHCVNCIKSLLELSNINASIHQAIAEACCTNMCSTDPDVKESYSQILETLPLSVVLRQVHSSTGIYRAKTLKRKELQHLHTATMSLAPMREKYFKTFIEKLSFTDETEFVENFFKDIYAKCLTMHQGRASEFYFNAFNDVTCLTSWAQWEAAQHCVNNKLRTLLGKPQDTFLKIEAIVKDAARILALKESSQLKNVDLLLAYQKNTRVLLGFLECLEKAIYNAAEGTAFAIPAPEKSVKTFFRVNTATCNEWFNRIRTAVDLVALHAMEPEMVIRYCEDMLNSLVSARLTGEVLFEHTLVFFVWALLRNGEADTLWGLYTWTKTVSGKRIPWIRHAAEHAAGHREKAAEGYATILHSKDDKLDKTLNDFILSQLTDCLNFTGQSKDIFGDFWCEFNAKYAMTTTEAQFSDFTKTGGCSTISEMLHLTDWTVFDQPESIPNNFSYHKVLSVTENTLMAIAMNDDDNTDAKLKLCKGIVHSSIQECLRTETKEYLSHLAILNHVIHKLYQIKIAKKDSNLSTFDPGSHVFSSTDITSIVQWVSILSNVKSVSETYNCDIHLETAAAARKDNNLKFCKNELEKFFKILKYDDSFILPDIVSVIAEEDHNRPEFGKFLRGACEAAKWFQSQNKYEEALDITAVSCLKVLSINAQLPEEISERYARILLIISDWLSQGIESIISKNNNIANLLNILPEVPCFSDEATLGMIPPIDIAVGKCMFASTQQCPKVAKAWSAFGNWCYRWGRKILETRSKSDSNVLDLRPNDVEIIKNLIPNASESEVEDILQLLYKHHVTPDDDEIGTSDINSTEMIESQLRELKVLSDTNDHVISSIILLWRQVHKSIYKYYEIAAEAYFKYLDIASPHGDQPTIGDSESNGDCSLVTATLRILRLVVKYALGLQEVIEHGLTTTPTRPWKVIIPQLFSRLNHHEPYVRKRVSELLCRVAKDSPHLIIFPAVVGAMEEFTDNSYARNNFTSSEDEGNTSNAMTICFNSLLGILSEEEPETVDQVQLLVRELKRITLLWDEFWLHSLTQLYAEYSELFNSLEAEIRKGYEDNKNLLQTKHRVLMGHVVDDMQNLLNSTSRTPETNHERIFQEKYLNIIKLTIEELEKPLNWEKPIESWHKIKQLYAMFQQKLQKSSQIVLKMADISPVLANMKDTAISMPGVETSDNKPIYIKSIDNNVYILPTKTKPKKLAFFGSDGRKYTYLFKGLEDLHLDERIMQFLSISNSMMSKSVESNNNTTLYRAHHYSVIPLGGRSGLIHWVDGVTPIFAMYKKWQQREAANAKKDKPISVMRPSEMFYNKLRPLLKEHNIKTTDNRKLWPISVLRKVLEDLIKQTPNDLLAKELWCNSINPVDWRRSVRTYSLSVAVMSVIGYVIGLGDRHLDNILVKLSTGEIVHIDYNVCFEKGKTLRVPEKVPFRMTPNIEYALGITGIEGTFRLACEHVLRTLRKERETLLTLLEAFVYDPLVDWAMSDDGTTMNTKATKASIAAAEIGSLEASAATSESTSPATNPERKQSRKKLDNEVMRNSLSSRFAEIKPEWTQYRHEITEQLSQMIKYVDELDKKRENIHANENERNLLSKQQAMVRELQALGTAMSSHPLNTISQRYAECRRAQSEFENLNQILAEESEKYKTLYELYRKTASEFNANVNNAIVLELDQLSGLVVENEFEVVKTFLENSAQGVMYHQAEQARRELDNLFVQQANILKCTLATLEEYFQIMYLYPKCELRNHRLLKYHQWIQALFASPDDYSNILKDFDGVRAQEKFNKNHASQVNFYAGVMENTICNVNSRLTKHYEILQKEIVVPDEKMLEQVKESISTFKQTEIGAAEAMHCAVSITFCKAIEYFLRFEEKYKNSFGKTSELQPDIYAVFNKQAIYLMFFKESAKIFINEEFTEPLQFYLDALQSVLDVIQCLSNIEIVYMMEIVPKLVHLLMAENEDYDELVESIIALDGVVDFVLAFNKNEVGINCVQEERLLAHHYQKSVESVEDEIIKDLFKTLEEIFDKIENSIDTSLAGISKLPQTGRMLNLVGHLVRSKTITARIIEQHSTELLQQWFKLKKYETISQIFAVAKRMVVSLKENKLDRKFDPSPGLDETTAGYKLWTLRQPILSYAIACENKAVCGLGPLICSLLEDEFLNLNMVDDKFADIKDLTELVNIQFDEQVRAGVFSHSAYGFAQMLCDNLSATLKEYGLMSKLKRQATYDSAAMNHLRLIATVHYWYNDKYFTKKPSPPHIASKELLLQSIQSTVQNLNAWKISIDKINSELSTFTIAIMQRLKWAVGANPSLASLQQTFCEYFALQEKKFNEHMKIATTVLEYCLSVVEFENLKSNQSEKEKSDDKLLKLLSKFYNADRNRKTSAAKITTVENAIVQLLDPEGPIDHFWIDNVSELLDVMTDTVQRELAKLEKDLHAIQDNLQMSAHKLRLLLDNELRMDIRYLTKLIVKFDQRSKQFQNKYKQMFFYLSDLHMRVLSKDFTEDNVKEIRELIGMVRALLEDVYNGLLKILSDKTGLDNFTKIKAERDDELSAENLSKDGKKNTQPEQRRNAYAVSVWRRIRMKLEGRDPDPNRRMTVTEQVDWMIREATNPDNLAVLYEGWTPWV